MIKKTIAFVVAGSVAAVVIKDGYDYVQEVRETNRNIEQMERLLDPFVIAYKESKDRNNAFKRVIKEKLTTEDVRTLRKILLHRKRQLRSYEGFFEYSLLLEAIDECLPVVGSINDIKNRFTSKEENEVESM